ncbi:MAG: hypothetical protein AAFO07_00720 [Bacteroidota bacterium]
MKKSLLVKTLLIVFISCITIPVQSQGGWNIEYVPIDSIKSEWIGREIRIDFKSFKSDTIEGRINRFTTHELLSKRDSGVLKINGKDKVFVEDWVLHIDLGSFKEQQLKGKNNKSIIKEIFIKEMSSSTLTVALNIYKKKDIKRKKEDTYFTEVVTLDRKLIKGILINNNHD